MLTSLCCGLLMASLSAPGSQELPPHSLSLFSQEELVPGFQGTGESPMTVMMPPPHPYILGDSRIPRDLLIHSWDRTRQSLAACGPQSIIALSSGPLRPLPATLSAEVSPSFFSLQCWNTREGLLPKGTWGHFYNNLYSKENEMKTGNHVE